MGPTRPLWLVFLGQDKDPAWDPLVYTTEKEAMVAAALLGLTEKHVHGFATNRQLPQPMHQGWLAYVIDRRWMLAKTDLKDGAWYLGACRNAVLAQWDEKRNGFIYIRHKWTARFPETILHPTDDVGWDCFWPCTMAHAGPVVEDIRGQGCGNGVKGEANEPKA